MNDRSSLDGFLSEFGASLSQDTQDAFLRRVTAEAAIKLAFEELYKKQVAENIRVIPDRQLASQKSADFLVQIDDYDIRLELLDAPANEHAVSQESLQGWVSLLESHPNTAVLIVVWADNNLSSIALTMRRLKYLLNNPTELEKLSKNIDPFEDVISSVIKKQTKGWKIPKIEPNKPSSSKRDLYSIFSEKIISAIDVEANRSYRTEERVKAARSFPLEREKQAILKILQDALDGKPAKDLEKRLTSLPRRGE
jgi:hypothetical protein